MPDRRLRSLALTLLTASALVGAGCGDDDAPPAADSTGGASSDGTATGSMVSATSQGTNSSADTTAGPTTDGMDTAGFLGGSTDDGPLPPQPNGSPCEGPLDCESGYCFPSPLPGVPSVCSECVDDVDCDMGTCSLDPTVLYAVCTDGGIGVMCDSDEGCMGDLVCTTLVETGGLIPTDFCSECRPGDVPCADGDVCSPVYDLASFQGYHACLPPNSVEDGGGCPVTGPVGDGTVCQSGSCGVALIMGIIPIGVCGECVTDMDCMGPSTCQGPTVDMGGIMPAVCI